MVLNRVHVLLKDDRSDTRIPEKGNIPWQIKYKKREGIAKLRDISTSGMQIETRASFDPKNECIFSFDSDEASGLAIPQIGRLVWHRKKRFSRDKYLCGIKFLEADESILKQMRSRVQQGVSRFVKKRRITTVAGYIVCATAVVLISALVWVSNDIYQNISTANQRMLGVSGEQAILSKSFKDLYQANEILLNDASEKLHISNQLIMEDQAALALFSVELEATKALLSQTETMLSNAKNDNSELTERIDALSSKEADPFNELGKMSVADARSLVSIYRQRIQTIKKEIKRLKSPDHAARAAMLSRIDDQMLAVGNNGFLVKEGQSVQVDESQYQNLIDQSHNAIAPAVNQNVEIDITFFE